MTHPKQTIPEEYQGLVELLTYCRPSYSEAATQFGVRFLMPHLGMADLDGNYYCSIQDNEGGTPRVAFMAHYDTVHYDAGRQVVEVAGDVAKLPEGSQSSCLGADCTTGLWLILEMIKAKVPGHYMVFANEEVGCVGSKAFAANNRSWLETDVDFAISFDRMYNTSIITHQMSMRTASDTFAYSLAAALKLNLSCDTGGSFTDSNEFVDIIGECTNLSVGYRGQHSKREQQDLAFAVKLRDRLLEADWSLLIKEREAGESEYDWGWGGRNNWYRDYKTGGGAFGSKDRYDSDGYYDPMGKYDYSGNLIVDDGGYSYDRYDKAGNPDPDGAYDALGNYVLGYRSSPRSERLELLDLLSEDPSGVVSCMIEFGLTSEIVKRYLTEESISESRRASRLYGNDVY